MYVLAVFVTYVGLRGYAVPMPVSVQDGHLPGVEAANFAADCQASTARVR